MSVHSFLEALATSEPIREAAVLGHFQIASFVELLLLLRPQLLWTIPSSTADTPPDFLPLHVVEFLQLSVDISAEECAQAWVFYRHLIWTHDLSLEEETGMRTKHVHTLLAHGVSRQIGEHEVAVLYPTMLIRFMLGVYNFLPQTRVCLDPKCTKVSSSGVVSAKDLGHGYTFRITVFTHDLGAVPGFSTSFYCYGERSYDQQGSTVADIYSGCNTRYHHDYYVHTQASLETYYNGTPTFVQASKHAYISTTVCQNFCQMMVSAWYVLMRRHGVCRCADPFFQGIGHKLCSHLQ